MESCLGPGSTGRRLEPKASANATHNQRQKLQPAPSGLSQRLSQGLEPIAKRLEPTFRGNSSIQAPLEPLPSTALVSRTLPYYKDLVRWRARRPFPRMPSDALIGNSAYTVYGEDEGAVADARRGPRATRHREGRLQRRRWHYWHELTPHIGDWPKGSSWTTLPASSVEL